MLHLASYTPLTSSQRGYHAYITADLFSIKVKIYVLQSISCVTIILQHKQSESLRKRNESFLPTRYGTSCEPEPSGAKQARLIQRSITCMRYNAFGCIKSK